jgi:cytoskeletal protein RodZ
MESLGLYLKELREEKGFSLEVVSDQTRIPIHYIQSIEGNKFKDFASIGYARATLSKYVKFLHGNESKVILTFNNMYNIDNNIYNVENVGSNNFSKKYLLSTQSIAYFFLTLLVIFLGMVTLHFAKSGMLKSPFKSIMKNEKQKEPSEKMKNKIAIKDTILKKAIAEEIAKNEIKINEISFLDTTDYVNQLLFVGKNSPLNYKKINSKIDGN